MEEIVKHINDTNASFRTPNAGDAKNTDLFLDNEQYDLFKDEGEQITVRYNKENLSKAILFIASILPRKYDNSGMHKSITYSSEFVYDQLAFLDYFFKESGVSVDKKTQKWNVRKNVPKKNGEIDNRFYFNGLLDDVEYVNVKKERVSSKFTIRNYLAGGYSDLHIKRANDGIFDVWVTNVQQPYFDDKEELEIEDKSSHNNLPLQTIFYGAPGTGKSYKVKSEKLAGVPEENIFRTTFHPDYDYASFVGCYKPTKEKMPLLDHAQLLNVFNTISEPHKLCKIGFQYWKSFDTINKNQFLTDCKKETQSPELNAGINLGRNYQQNNADITYSFVPQVFTNAYIKAWKNPEQNVYLIIEEINRGNCAQIFGDIFQLLDRKENGYSEYPIDIDEDLKNYLVQELGADSEGIKDGKLCLPPNLNLLATMNTSDQSLFPMDSAFKRRWDWEYVAITNAEKNWQIKIDENDKPIDWWTFLQSINMVIADLTSSEDKQLGYFFTKPDKDSTTISAKRFVSKVIFYLWNDVFKNNSFEHDCCKDDAGKEVLYAKFYAENGKDINLDVLRRFFMKLKDENGNPLL